jgi:hypothetical protein
MKLTTKQTEQAYEAVKGLDLPIGSVVNIDNKVGVEVVERVNGCGGCAFERRNCHGIKCLWCQKEGGKNIIFKPVTIE